MYVKLQFQIMLKYRFEKQFGITKSMIFLQTLLLYFNNTIKHNKYSSHLGTTNKNMLDLRTSLLVTTMTFFVPVTDSFLKL